MNKLERIKSLYKPYRYTIRGKCTILETTSGNFVLKRKPQNKDLISIFNYLESRDFNYFPHPFDETRGEYIIYEYVEDRDSFNPHKSEDLISLVGLLHSKTSYNKEVTENNFKEIYENIKNNIMYLKDYYQKYYDLFITEIYNSPSHYEFLRSYSKINASLNFCEQELDNWYESVKEKNNTRVALIHNNLTLDHYVKNEREYLLSWDNAKFDTPILDLVNLYHKNFWNIEFNNIYNRYNEISGLSEDEQKLFFILISLPPEINFEGSEFTVTKNMREKLDYIYKTEEFLKPYYATNTTDE